MPSCRDAPCPEAAGLDGAMRVACGAHRDVVAARQPCRASEAPAAPCLGCIGVLHRRARPVGRSAGRVQDCSCQDVRAYGSAGSFAVRKHYCVSPVRGVVLGGTAIAWSAAMYVASCHNLRADLVGRRCLPCISLDATPLGQAGSLRAKGARLFAAPRTINSANARKLNHAAGICKRCRCWTRAS